MIKNYEHSKKNYQFFPCIINGSTEHMNQIFWKADCHNLDNKPGNLTYKYVIHMRIKSGCPKSSIFASKLEESSLSEYAKARKDLKQFLFSGSHFWLFRNWTVQIKAWNC